MATNEKLVAKLARVMGAIEHVPKNGRNNFHGYDYATEADIVAAVRAEMSKEGVMLIPSVEKVEWTAVPTKSGTERLATLTVAFTVTDGVEEQKFVVLGEGQDRGDKATYKAMTGALKYALLKLFLIPTGDDPEREQEEEPARAARGAPREQPNQRAQQRPPHPAEQASQHALPPPGRAREPGEDDDKGGAPAGAAEGAKAAPFTPAERASHVRSRLVALGYKTPGKWVAGVLSLPHLDGLQMTDEQYQRCASILAAEEKRRVKGSVAAA